MRSYLFYSYFPNVWTTTATTEQFGDWSMAFDSEITVTCLRSD